MVMPVTVTCGLVPTKEREGVVLVHRGNGVLTCGGGVLVHRDNGILDMCKKKREKPKVVQYGQDKN